MSVVPAPAMAAQGPGPVGLHQLSTRPAGAPVVATASAHLRRDSSHATTGFLIGFMAGFIGVQLPYLGKEDTGVVRLLALGVGVVTGWVGYMIGRGKD